MSYPARTGSSPRRSIGGSSDGLLPPFSPLENGNSDSS